MSRLHVKTICLCNICYVSGQPGNTSGSGAAPGEARACTSNFRLQIAKFTSIGTAFRAPQITRAARITGSSRILKMATDIAFKDKKLLPLWHKLQEGERFSLADGLILMGTNDLIALGKMAATVQQEINGHAVYFAMNQKIEPSNICVLACRFCNFAVKPRQPGAYDMSIEDILRLIKPEVREVHITGSLHPDRPWSYYLDMIRRIKEEFPATDVKAFTAVEIDYFRRKFKLPVREVLQQLRDAGLDALPGGGAEVFSERVRRLLCPRKIGAETWLKIHQTAHLLGIRSNATLLYGHIETCEERLQHLLRLRELQDETDGFLAFIPLAFQPGRTDIKPPLEFTSAIEDLKMIAVSRLMLDNFPHIKAYWVMLTEDVAATALNFGADDLEGTVGGEKIAHDAGAVTPMSLAGERLINIIREAGKIPVERDAHYRPLAIHDAYAVGKIPYLNSLPFYNHFERGRFKLLPITPRHMGLLADKGLITAGLFSLMDYLSQEDRLEVMNYGLAVRGQVQSVLLFSRCPWSDLAGKKIGVTDATATSVQLLRVLLEKKYKLKAHLERMPGNEHDYRHFDAVLLIGDEALQHYKCGLPGFKNTFDLAREWYAWQKLPFVFAVWAVKKTLAPGGKRELKTALRRALAQEKLEPSWLNALHGRRIGLTPAETAGYLAGFTYRLGKTERKAIEVFRDLAAAVEVLEEQKS